MVAATKFYQVVEDKEEGVYTSSTDQFTVFLTTHANIPVVANAVLADITEISYTNLSTRDLTTNSSGQTSGILTHLFTDLVLTASGAVATFRHVGIYNNTPASPLDPIVFWFDFGQDLTLASAETLTLDWTTSSWTVE